MLTFILLCLWDMGPLLDPCICIDLYFQNFSDVPWDSLLPRTPRMGSAPPC